MKICYVTLGFMPATQLGGPIQNSYNLLKRLVSRGHSVTVCCTNLASKRDKLFPTTQIRMIEGIEVIYFNTYKLFPLGIGSFGLYVSPELPDFFRRRLNEFDIVHIDGYRDSPSITASVFARKYNIPYVIQARGTLPAAFNSIIPKRIFDSIYGRKMLNKSKLLIASSDEEQLQYCSVSKNSRLNIKKIYNGFDLTEFEILPETTLLKQKYNISKKYIISYLGRIHKLKGIDYLVKAFSISRHRHDAVLLIAGPDEGYQSALLALAESEKITESIMFLGRLDDREKIEFYTGSDAVVYATQSESFGMVAFEAAICKTPVIVSKGTGCGSVISEFEAGFTVDYGDYEGLASQIDSILDKRNTLETKMLLARQKIFKDLSWDTIAGEYEEAYFSALHVK